MSERKCTVSGCDRRYRCSGYCGLHYNRWLNRGTTDDPPPSPWPTSCTVEGCDRKHCANRLCKLHYYRLKNKGTLAAPEARTDINYQGAHFRVTSARGSATKYKCCDCERQAQEWSYTHNDPGQLVDNLGRPYSLDVSHYVPRCRKCHRGLDNGRRKTPCIVDGCDRLMKAKGLCPRHYQSARKAAIRETT